MPAHSLFRPGLIAPRFRMGMVEAVNWLAHVFLSPDDIHYRLGNLVADMVKGRAWEGVPEEAIRGIMTHRAIDSFTDNHPVVKRSMHRLGSRGLLRGVAIDVTYDHMLAKNWERYSPLSLGEFLHGFYAETRDVLSHYPPRMREFLSSIVENNRLSPYDRVEAIQRTLRRIDGRLSQRVLRRETTSALFPRIEENYDALNGDFQEFFPKIRQYVSDLG